MVNILMHYDAVYTNKIASDKHNIFPQNKL